MLNPFCTVVHASLYLVSDLRVLVIYLLKQFPLRASCLCSQLLVILSLYTKDRAHGSPCEVTIPAFFSKTDLPALPMFDTTQQFQENGWPLIATFSSLDGRGINLAVWWWSRTTNYRRSHRRLQLRGTRCQAKAIIHWQWHMNNLCPSLLERQARLSHALTFYGITVTTVLRQLRRPIQWNREVWKYIEPCDITMWRVTFPYFCLYHASHVYIGWKRKQSLYLESM